MGLEFGEKGRRKRLPHKASEFGMSLQSFESRNAPLPRGRGSVTFGIYGAATARERYFNIDEDAADEIGGGPVGIEIIDDYNRAFKAIAFENGFEVFERVAPGKGVVRVDPQLEDEAEATAETARRFHQEHALAGDGGERQVALSQQVPQIGSRFHSPR